MAYTDITTRAGKGSRLEHNVSTKRYREGWDRIFGKKRSKLQTPANTNEPKIFRCPECKGYGQRRSELCQVCDGTGRLIMYAD